VCLARGETYSELANFDVVDTGGFFFFRGTQSEGGDEAANEVEGAEDEAGA
jgi:hypothetical protein